MLVNVSTITCLNHLAIQDGPSNLEIVAHAQALTTMQLPLEEMQEVQASHANSLASSRTEPADYNLSAIMDDNQLASVSQTLTAAQDGSQSTLGPSSTSR